MRIPRRYLVKALAYPLILGAILLALKTQDHYADIGPYWRKLQDIRQVQPQTVFLGSSRTQRHVDPVRLDSIRDDGTVSYNFGIPGSRALETHFRADKLLEMEIPSVERLVLEFGPISVSVPPRVRGTRRSQHYHDFRRASLGARVALASERPLRRRVHAAADRWRYWTMNTFLVGWGRPWLNSVLTERAGDHRAKPIGRRGYTGLREEDVEREDASEILRTRRAFALSPEGQAEIARRIEAIRNRASYVPTKRDSISAEAWITLAERANARGIEVLYIEQVGTEYSAGVTALVREALGHDAVIVLNDPVQYPEFFVPEAWFDEGHLKEEMAKRATDILAERLPPPR